MSVFREMFDQHNFESLRDYTEVLRMLGEAIARGYIEEVAVALNRGIPTVERWYRDKDTGEIYALIPPEQAARGYWGPIQLEEYEVGKIGYQ